MGETQVPLPSLIWTTSAVVTWVAVPVSLGSQMVQGWHGETQPLGETQVPLPSLIWSTLAVVARPVLLENQMVQG